MLIVAYHIASHATLIGKHECNVREKFCVRRNGLRMRRTGRTAGSHDDRYKRGQGVYVYIYIYVCVYAREQTNAG